MLFDRPSRSDLALNDYWNALNANAPGDELERLAAAIEPTELAAMHRARRSKQRFSPDPLFVRQLEATLMNISISSAAAAIPQAQAGSQGKRVDAAGRGRTIRPAKGGSIDWRLSSAIAFVMVAAILIAIVGGIWLTTNPNDGNRIVQPAATPNVEATPDDGSNFPMYRGNSGRSGVVNAPGPSGSPVELWTLTGLPAAFSWSSAIVDGVLYAGGGDEGLIAVDALTGDRLWNFQTELPVDSGPAVGHGLVFFADIDGELFAIDISSHAERWSFPGTRPNSAPTLSDDLLYIVTAEGTFYALNASTGEVVWDNELRAAAAGAPAVADGIALQNSADQTIHAFDALTGEPRWTFSGGVEGGMATPTVAHGVVYVTTDGLTNNMFALDLTTGEEIWRIDREVGQAFISATATAERVFSISEDAVLHALDARDGAAVWTYQLGGFARAVPILAGNTIYIVDNAGFVRAISATNGTEIWSYPVEGAIGFNLSVAGEVVYTGTETGNFYAITGDGSYVTMVGAGLIEPYATEPAATPEVNERFDTTKITVLWTSGPEAGLSSGLCGASISPIDGRIYVVDCIGHAIQIFENNGTFVESWNDFGTASGEFRFDYPGSPAVAGGIDFDSEGNMYVFDSLNHRIQKFSPKREFISMWGEFGTGPGQFNVPVGAVDRENELIYVSDVYNDRIQVFDLDGTFIETWGSVGGKPGDLFSPTLALRGDGTLFISSEGRPRITHFTVGGELIAVIAEESDGIGWTWSMTVDAAGNLWAASWDLNVIHVYSPTGDLLGEIREIDGLANLRGPVGLAFDQNGNLVIALDGLGLAKVDVSGLFGD